MTLPDQTTIGYLIERLKRLNQDKYVMFDFVDFFPTRLHSYRGYYEQIAFGYANKGGFPTVRKVLAMLEDAIGKDFTGYKGGEYTMDADTPVWVSEPDESCGTAIIDVEDGVYVILKTAKID